MVTRRRLRTGMTVALVACSGIASPVQASETAVAAPSPIVTDRPTDSASPVLVPRRVLQIEAGYKFTRSDRNSGRTDTQELPDLLMRYGISQRIEARLTATGWTFKNTPSGEEDGFNDVSLGVKIGLAKERSRRPQMGLLADVSLPVGATAITDDYVIPKVLFLAAHSLTDQLGLTYNVGPRWVTAEKDGERRSDVDLNYAVALSVATAGKASLFGEVYGALRFNQDRADSHTLQAGATVLWTRNFQVDLRGGVGLVDREPDWLVGFGFAFRLPL